MRWAPPVREDVPAWERLLSAMEAVDARGEVHDRDDLADEWDSVWADPERDARMVWDGDELVAFGWMRTIPGDREAHRLDLWGGVRPDRRGQGIGRRLLAWQLARARQVAPSLPVGPAVRVELSFAEHQADVTRLAAAAGLSEARRYLEVARPVEAPVDVPAAPPGLTLARWSADLDDAMRRAHGESFADHWGSEERSPEAWRQWYTGHRSFRADLSHVAVVDATGEVAGQVLVSTYPQDWQVGPREAWITQVGTRPAWRRRGVARWLLCHALADIASAPDALERAILGVDARNGTGALELYDGLGFRPARATLTYALELDRSRAMQINP
jgi:mycothiol synthase